MTAPRAVKMVGWTVGLLALGLFVLVPLAGIAILWLLEQGGG